MKKEVTPKTESKIAEFLVFAKDEEGEYLGTCIEDFIGTKSTVWLQEFCQELEILVKFRQVCGDAADYLKTKNQE